MLVGMETTKKDAHVKLTFHSADKSCLQIPGVFCAISFSQLGLSKAAPIIQA